MAKGSYKWRPETRTFTRGDKTVSRDKLKKWVDLAVESSKAQLEEIAIQYRTGKINLAQFRISTGGELKRLHSSMAMMANGGRNAISTKGWARTGAKLRSEFAYLNSFRAALLGKEPSLLGDDFVERVKMYADAGYAQYENQVRGREKDAGVKRARRVKVGDDTTCPGCNRAATEDFLPINDVLPIGDADCLSRCRCHIEYKTELKSIRLVPEVDEGPKQINIAYKLKGVEGLPPDAQVVITVNRPEV